MLKTHDVKNGQEMQTVVDTVLTEAYSGFPAAKRLAMLWKLEEQRKRPNHLRPSLARLVADTRRRTAWVERLTADGHYEKIAEASYMRVLKYMKAAGEE